MRLAMQLVFSFLLTAQTMALAAGTLTPIALTGTDGDLGPQLGPGIIFTGLSRTQSMNDAGELVFQGSITPATGLTNNGIWKATPTGELNLIARTGNLSTVGPGIPGATFSFLGRPIVSENGTVGFSALYNSPGGGGTGLFIATNQTSPQAVALSSTDGSKGPNLGAGVQFSTFPLDMSTTNVTPFSADGKFTFVATLTGSGVTASNSMGVFLASAAGVTPVARSGDSGSLGPGLPAGATFLGFPNGDSPLNNGDGQIVFRSIVGGGNINFATQNGNWIVENGSAPEIVVQSGVSDGTGPGIPGTFTSLTRPSINSDGIISFAGTVNPTAQGAWQVLPGESPTPLMLTGTDGPLGPGLGAGVIFSSLPGSFIGMLSNDNQLFTPAQISGPGVTSLNDTGIWKVSASGIELVLREGSYPSIEGLPANISISTLFDPLMTDHGFIVGALLQGPGVDGTNNQAALSWFDNKLSLIVRNGDLVDVDPTSGQDLRRVTQFDVFGNPFSSGSDGLPNSFNTHNLLSMRLTFQDGSAGIFTTSVPELSGLVMCGISLMTLFSSYVISLRIRG